MRSLRPTTSAARPPMPASTSSKIMPGADSLGSRSSASLKPRRPAAVSVFTASMIRDSSPPETIRASGRRSSPRLGDTKNSTVSRPVAVHAGSGRGSALNRTSNDRAVHRQFAQQALELTCETRRGSAPGRGQLTRSREKRRPCDLVIAHERRDVFVGPGKLVELRPHASPSRDHVRQGRPVLPLHTLEQREPLLDLLQPRRRGLDTVRITTQEQREVLELRFDGVPPFQIRLKRRVERRQLRDASPDAAELRENRTVALVQRRIALAAPALDALGAGQDLTCGGELVVLSRGGCRAIQLRRLKCQDLLAGPPVGGRLTHASQRAPTSRITEKARSTLARPRSSRLKSSSTAR